jgi:hypothetical protein
MFRGLGFYPKERKKFFQKGVEVGWVKIQPLRKESFGSCPG